MNKLVLTTVFLLRLISLSVSQENIKSNVYSGQKAGPLFEGSNNPMSHFKAELFKLNAGRSLKANTASDEHLVISKAGSPWIYTNKLNSVLSPRSIAVVTKGNKYRIINHSTDEAWFYVISYQSKDQVAGSDSLSAFVRSWENVPFHPHERGGAQSYFDIASSQTKRLELHLTTLNAGLKSHDPHTHASEEIILMIRGETKMLIGEKYFEARGGDVYYVESMLRHGIENTGKTPCSYFAFQWQ